MQTIHSDPLDDAIDQEEREAVEAPLDARFEAGRGESCGDAEHVALGLFDDLVAGEEDFLSVEEDLPTFKPTPFNFTEWVNAYSPALVEGGLIWDEASRALAEPIEHGFTHSRVRQAIASHSRSGKTMLLQLGISWFTAKHNLPVVWATAPWPLPCTAERSG